MPIGFLVSFFMCIGFYVYRAGTGIGIKFFLCFWTPIPTPSTDHDEAGFGQMK